MGHTQHQTNAGLVDDTSHETCGQRSNASRLSKLATESQEAENGIVFRKTRASGNALRPSGKYLLRTSHIATPTSSETDSSDDAESLADRISQIAMEQEVSMNGRPNETTGKFPKKPVESQVSHDDADHSVTAKNLHYWPQNPRIEVTTEANNDIDDAKSDVSADVQDADTSRISSRIKNCSRLPEKGKISSLESRRNRSTTDAGLKSIRAPGFNTQTQKSVDNSSIGVDQLVLNIRRSTWTLSDFDDAFYKLDSKIAQGQTAKQMSDSTSSLPGIGQNSSELAASQLRWFDKLGHPDADNLLVRASANAAMNKPKPSGRSDNPAWLDANQERRPSHTHSLVSFASSGDTPTFPGFGRKRKRRESKDVEWEHNRANQTPDQEDQGACCKSSSYGLRLLGKYVPIFEWLPNYKLQYLYGDLMAGIAVAVLNISTSLSAAVVAETSLGAAFKTSIVNTFFYAILCSSKHTSFGSYSIMSQMLLVSVQRALSDELILDRLNLGPSTTWDPQEYERWHLAIIVMFTFLIGLIQLICGFLNLGFIVSSFIPDALSSPLIAATAFTTAIGQLANMCGTSNKILWSIEKNTTELWADLKDPPIDITDLFADSFRWVKQIILLVKYRDQINLLCVLISVICLIILCLNQFLVQKYLSRVFKKNIMIPIELILLIIMILISRQFELEHSYQVPTCGPIEIEMTAPDLPDLRLIRELWAQSLATAMISYTTVYIMSKTYANKLNYEVNSNQELIACGSGNLIGGLFDAMPAAASFSRTAGQVEAGGQTQMASLVNCAVLVIIVHLFGQQVSFLPTCVMAATLFFGFARMMTRVTDIFRYWRVCKVDFAIWVATFGAILVTDLINGFVYGFIFSILTMLYRAQNRRCYMLGGIKGSPDVYVPLAKYPTAEEVNGIKIFQFCGPIHYISADLYERLLRSKTKVNVKRILKMLESREIEPQTFNPRDMNLPSHIILDFSMISSIDSAGIQIIRKIIEDHRQVNISILIASPASHVASTFKSEPSLWDKYKKHFYVTLVDAAHHAARESRLNSEPLASLEAKESCLI